MARLDTLAAGAVILAAGAAFAVMGLQRAEHDQPPALPSYTVQCGAYDVRFTPHDAESASDAREASMRAAWPDGGQPCEWRKG